MDCASTHADYHVTCQGNERKAIFRDDTDRALFLDKLNSSREIYVPGSWGHPIIFLSISNFVTRIHRAVDWLE
jgi:hypothetical protein